MPDFRTTARCVAENARKGREDDRAIEQAQYRVTMRARVRLADP